MYFLLHQVYYDTIDRTTNIEGHGHSLLIVVSKLPCHWCGKDLLYFIFFIEAFIT